MKQTPPRLRATSVQPARVTVWPIRVSSTRPQKWVRMENSAGGCRCATAPERFYRPRPVKPVILRPGRCRSKSRSQSRPLKQGGAYSQPPPELNGDVTMKRHLLLALLATALPAAVLATLPTTAHAQATRAYAPEDLRQLSRADRARVIEREYADQSRGRRIPDDQLEFYLDQVNSGWGFSRIKQDIATSLRGNGNWNGGGNGNGNTGTIRCESADNRRRVCNTGWRGATLVRQLSYTQCIAGRNWGSSNGSIWVSNGCRAEFAQGP